LELAKGWEVIPADRAGDIKITKKN